MEYCTFQPPVTQMDHGNLQRVPSPACEKGRLGRPAGTESSGNCIWGWGLLWVSPKRLSRCKEREMLHSQGPWQGLETEKPQSLIYQSRY